MPYAMNNDVPNALPQFTLADRASVCRPLFAELKLLAGRIAPASHLLLGLDYDGTLTPLVDDPSAAALAPEMREVLQALAARPETTVAIISGRRLQEVRTLVGLDGLFYAGNHGLEICGRGFDFIEVNAVRMQRALGWLAAALARNLSHIAGVIVENKGLTISVHYRLAPPTQKEEVLRHVQAATAVAPDCFQIGLGNHVFDVRPQVDWHKGSALGWIAKQLGIAKALTVVLGDDRTDEDAFRAHSDGITVRIGEPGSTSAAYHLDGPAQVREFLHWLAQVGKEGGVP